MQILWKSFTCDFKLYKLHNHKVIHTRICRLVVLKMQPYFGSLEALNDPRNAALRRSHCAVHSPKQQLKMKQRQMAGLNIERDERRRRSEGINVNVSGKYFNIAYEKLQAYPESLLSDPKKRKRYFDFKKKEYFFDHNRIVAESVYHFYEYGQLVKPPNIPEQLLSDELKFFGIYDYLNEAEKENCLGMAPEVKQLLESQTSLRRNIWLLLEKPETNMSTRIYNSFSLALIIFSVFLLCLDTYDANNTNLTNNASSLPNAEKSYRISKDKNSWIFISESICIAFFTLELSVRFLVSWNKRKFLSNVLNLIDFVAIIPFYISLVLDLHIVGASLAVLRVLRLGKIFRVLKISRYTSSLQIIIQTLSSGRKDLWMLFFLLLVQALFFASVTYYFEQIWAAADTDFTSIPSALWWALVSSLTIGYGDMVPKSFAGKLSGAVCAVSGVVVMAPILPIIFDRWTRYNRLYREARLRKKFQQKYSQEEIDHLNVIRVQSGKKQSGFIF